MVILGVTVSNHIGFETHINKICCKARQSKFALRILVAHGLCGQRLFDVVRATTLYRMLYAWWGYANLGDRKRLNSIVKKLSRSGFLPADEPSFDNHCTSADSALFRSVLSNPCHILHSLLPPRKNNPYYMRSRPHDRTLPRVDVFTKRNFIMRMLYDFI